MFLGQSAGDSVMERRAREMAKGPKTHRECASADLFGFLVPFGFIFLKCLSGQVRQRI